MLLGREEGHGPIQPKVQIEYGVKKISSERNAKLRAYVRTEST